MKYLKHMILVIAFLIISPQAMAAKNTWYTQTFAGLNSCQETMDLTSGYLVGLAIGKRLNPFISFEGELAYRDNKGSYDCISRNQSLSAMGNCLLNVASTKIATLYVGGGLGTSYTEINQSYVRSYYLIRSSYQSTSIDIKAQEMIGLKSPTFKYGRIGVEYRQSHNYDFYQLDQSVAGNFQFRF